MKKIIFSVFLFCSFLTYSAFAQFKVIGYLPTWMNFPNSINNVQLTKVTHINIAFANPNAAGTLIPSDGVSNANVTTVVNAAHAKGVKVFMSIGGASATGGMYSGLLNNTTNINNFVTKIVSYVNTYNLDGIDVDIEGNILDGTTITAPQYQQFVTALAAALHSQTPSKQMSAALGTWFAGYVTNTAAAQFDWINLMSYDAYGTWSGPGPHSPLSLAQSDFNYWKNTKGVPGSKLVIGVPFYGYGWGSYYADDEIPYCQIVNTYPGAENSDQIGSGANMISYNGIPTIKAKTTYALNNASGIMIWEIAEDCNDSKSLLTAIDQVIHPLPVNLVNFSGNNYDQQNQLLWSTSCERNCDFFNVERSSDGNNFQVIGKVSGSGNSNQLLNYSLVDATPLEGKNYYRLAQYDFDNKVNYSNSIIVDNNVNSIYQVSPNPFDNEITIKIEGSADVKLLQVMDLQGEVVYEASFSSPIEGMKIGGELDAGIYYLKILDGDALHVYKIIKRP